MVSRTLRGGSAAVATPASTSGEGSAANCVGGEWLGAYAASAAPLESVTRAVPTVMDRCALVDLPLFEGGSFIPDDAIKTAVQQAEASHAIIRVQGKLAADIKQLNAKIKLAGDCTSSLVIAETSHDRWILLASVNRARTSTRTRTHTHAHARSHNEHTVMIPQNSAASNFTWRLQR